MPAGMMHAMGEQQWYYAEQGQRRGPVALELLKELTVSGQLGASDFVWTEGMPSWQPVGQIPGLFAAGSTPPPLGASGGAIGYATPVGYGSQPPRLGDNAGTRWLLPVGRSPWAIVAGYLGLFSVLLLPAPLALIFALIAIRDIRRHPDRHGMGRAIFGLIMGLIFSALLGVMFVARMR
jgi:hypothetical protein